MLKKENFEIRGRILPIAYAVVRKTETNEYDRGAAFIGIAETRELALTDPLKEVIVQFEITNRDTNDRKAAYIAARTPRIVEQVNEKGKLEEVEVKPFFYDWQNAIIDY